MPIYNLNSSGISEVEEQPISEEKLRVIIERSGLQIIEKGLKLVGTNVSAGTGFIDTLAIDNNLVPIVIEYKVDEKSDQDALVQALDYANFVQRNPEIFSKFIKEKLGLDEEKLNMDDVSIIIVAPRFSERVINAAHQVEPPIQLLRYKYYENSLFTELVYDSTSTPIQRQPQDYTVNEKFERNYSRMKPIFDKLEQEVNKFGSDIRIYAKKYYIAFKRTYMFAVINNYIERIDISFTLDKNVVSNRLKETSSYGWSRFSHFVTINKIEDIDQELVGWLKNSYEQAK